MIYVVVVAHIKSVCWRGGGGAEASGQHFSPEKQKASVTQEIGWEAIIRPISHFIFFSKGPMTKRKFLYKDIIIQKVKATSAI